MKIIETERLILRTFEENDIGAMASIDQDPKVCEFLPAIGNYETTQATIKRIIAHFAQHGFSLYATQLKSTHEFIGWIGLNVPNFNAHFTPAVEIGWRLSSQHWNNAYATEGAKAVLHYAFSTLGLKEIVSFTTVNNLASRRVMEKIGMHHHSQDDFDHPKLPSSSPICRHVLYRITQDEFMSKSKK